MAAHFVAMSIYRVNYIMATTKKSPMYYLKTHNRSLLILGFIIGFSFVALAQQEPQYTNYMFNQIPINPAYTGSLSRATATLLSRAQWTGLEGAPLTTSFGFQSPFHRNKMGLGLSVVSDRHGPIENLFVNINYAYHIALSRESKLAFGLSAGFYNYSANLSSVKLDPAATGDPAFATNYQKNFQPNVGAGVYFYNKRLTIGFSAPKLLSARLANKSVVDNGVSNELRQHYFFSAAYKIPLNTEFTFIPQVFSKYVNGAPNSTDITGQFVYNKYLWFGATYRIGDAFAALLALQATSGVLVGYSYDYATTKLNGFNYGTHEIFLTFTFGFPKKNACDIEPLIKTYKRKQEFKKGAKPLNKS